MKQLVLLFAMIVLTSFVFAQDLKPKKDKDTKKYGYVDQADAWVIQPMYDDVEAFKDGIAKITAAKKVGLIDVKGTVLVAPTYDKIEAFKNGVATMSLNKKEGLITDKGVALLEPQYDNIATFKNGLATVSLLKKEGLITDKGMVLIAPKYDNIDNFKYGVAEVKLGTLFGLIDSTGKEILKPQFDKINAFSNGYAKVGAQTNFGLVKLDGTITIPAVYTQLDVLGTTVLVLKTNWGMLKTDGSVVFEPVFLEKPSFNVKSTDGNMLAIVKKLVPNSAIVSKGIINKEGKIILDFTFEYIAREMPFWVAKTLDKYWFFMNDAFKKVSDDYEDLTLSGKVRFTEGISGAKKGGKWGFINNTFQVVIPYQFDGIHADIFKNGYCGVKVGDLWGFIKKDGTYLQNPKFTSLESPMLKTKNVLSAMVAIGPKKFVFFENGTLTEMAAATPATAAPTATTIPEPVTTTPEPVATTASATSAEPVVPVEATPTVVPISPLVPSTPADTTTQKQ
jgi:hypothetical protein